MTLPQRVVRNLDVAIVSYLALPLAVFLGGTFRPLYALCLLALFALALVPLFRSTLKVPPKGNLAIKSIVAVLAIAVVWSVVGGSGHFVYAESDWMKHDAVYADLARYGWPTTYALPADSGPIIMRYYDAYYIVPALITKALGHHNLWMQCWTTLGVVLFGLRLVLTLKTPRQVAVTLGLFTVFGGMDLVGWFFMHPARLLGELNQQIDGWNGIQHLTRVTMIQYSDSSTMLFWVPQHALSAWLATMLVLDRDDDDFTLGSVALVLSVAFWSVFVAVGLLPFLALRWVRLLRREPSKAVFNPFVVGGLILTAFVGLFMLQGSGGNLHGFIWEFNTPYATVRRLVLFYGIEVLPLLVAMRFAGVRFGAFQKVAIGILLVLPLYYYGTYGDLAMRASIPALLVIFLGLRHLISDRGLSALWTRGAVPLLIVLAIGTYTVFPQLVLVVQEDSDHHPQQHERDMPALLAEIAADVPPAQYVAAEPDWIARMLRKQSPLYTVTSIRITDRASGWQIKDIYSASQLQSDAVGQAVFKPNAAGSVEALTNVELSKGLYRVRLAADVRGSAETVRASFGVGGSGHRMAAFGIDKGKTELDYFLRQVGPESKKMWLQVDGLNDINDQITITSISVERWDETSTDSDKRSQPQKNTL